MARKPCIVIYNGKRYTPERFMSKMMDGSLDRYIYPEMYADEIEADTQTQTQAQAAPTSPIKMRDKAILNAMAKAVPDSAKPKLEAEGFKYTPASKKEAKKIASQIIADMGIDEALDLVHNTRIRGDIRSFIFNLAMNELSIKERESTNQDEKIEIANKIADTLIAYDESARDSGRFNSAVYDFYLSPLGLEFYENKKREKAFKQIAKKEGQSWQSFFDELKSQPEFTTFVREQAAEMKIEDRNKARKAAQSIRNLSRKIKENGLKSVLPKWMTVEAPDGTKKSAIVDEKIIVKALEVIADAIDVGANVGEVIAQQVKKIKKSGVTASESDIQKYLMSQLGMAKDDKAYFEKQVEDKIKSLEKQVQTYKDKIAKKDAGTNTIKVTNEKIQELESELSELKKAYNEARKDFPSYKEKMGEKFLDRIKKKLSGLSQNEQAEVIRRTFKQLVENNALEYEEFQNIIADVLGLGKLDKETADKLKQSVDDINNLDEARKNHVKEQTPASEKALIEAERKAINARRELADVVYNQVDLSRTLKSALQLTAIGVPTILKNLTWNVGMQSMVRFPGHVVMAIADRAIYMASVALNAIFKTPKYERTTTLFGNEQKAFAKGLGQGSSEGANALISGISSKEYFEKEVYITPIKPINSAKELLEWAKGNRSMNLAEIVDKTIKASPTGYYMELVSRGLTFFDKPLRYGAETAKASQIGTSELKLSGKDLETFMRAPKEYAQQYFLNKGFTEEEANAKSDAIVERITEQGDKSVAQQNNFIADALKGLGALLDNAAKDKPIAQGAIGAGKVLTAPLSLFIKTPANIAWQVFNLVNPQFAVAQSLLFSFVAANKYKKGDASYKIEIDRAKDWMGTAAAGAALGLLTTFIASIGAVEDDDEEEKSKKERKAIKEYSKGNTINISKVNRYFNGEQDSESDEDLLVDLTWFGQLGSYLDFSKRMQDFTRDNPDAGAIDGIVEQLSESSKMAMHSSVLNSASVISQATQSYDGFKGYAVNSINTYANILQPQTFAQASRAQVPYEYRVKDDEFLNQLNNSFTARSSMYRKLTDQRPPSDIGVWGDVIGREGSPTLRFFGITIKSKDNFAQPIYEQYRKTGNTELLPPDVKNKFTSKGKETELPTDAARKLEQYVGQERKKLASPYVNDMARLRGFKKKFSQLTDDEKVDALGIIYDKGYEQGMKRFQNELPQYADYEMTKAEKREEKRNERKKRLFKKSVD